jgi:hypothetical protein
MMSPLQCNNQAGPQRKPSAKLGGLLSNERGMAAVFIALMIFVLTAMRG